MLEPDVFKLMVKETFTESFQSTADEVKCVQLLGEPEVSLFWKRGSVATAEVKPDHSVYQRLCCELVACRKQGEEE